MESTEKNKSTHRAEAVYPRQKGYDMTKAQILKYVPKSKIMAIVDAYTDEDGIWIYLADGWEASRTDRGCHTIHEDTVKQLRYQIAGIRREQR